MNVANESELDLNLLLTLDALLRERSVTRAARRLGVTQPAVSHRLRALREQLGDPLLVGSRRDLVLTERARAIAGPLAQALIDAKAALRAGSPFDAGSSERVFRMSTSDLGEFVVVPRVLEVLRAEAPGVRLFISPAPADPAASLAAGEIELIVGPPLPPQAGLVRQVVGFDDLVVLAREGHPAVRRGRMTVEAFAAQGHVQVSTGGLLVSAVDTALEGMGMRREVAVKVGHFVSAPFLVARSDLLLSVSRSFALESCRHLPLVMVEHPLKIPGFDVIMTWHERSQNDASHAWFRALAGRMTLACMPRRKKARG